MVFARGCFLMWVLLFLNSLLYTSTAKFPDTTYPHVDNIGYHSCRSFDENLGQRKLWKLELFIGRGNTIVSFVILVITLLNIIFHQLRKLQEGSIGEEKKPPMFSSEHLCRQFSLAEMQLATDNFVEASVIGKGGFGKVYRGLIDHGATTVAIKRLDFKSKQGASEFWTEVRMLSRFRHSNLVSLIGYCDDSDEMILVYEYVSGGNLGERLHKIDGLTKKSPLSWVERLKICIGAARALDYLHTGTGVRHRIIHRDVKSSNILLDENMVAKVSDFGLSKVGPADQTCTHVSTDVKGSFGYFDPNYFMTRRLTRKSDVYAFGVVLLEVLCGRPAIDLSLEDEEQGLVVWAQRCIREGMLNLIIDPTLRGLTPRCLRVKEQFLPSCVKTFVQIANKCLQSRPRERPTMAEVVVGLEALLAQQENALSNMIITMSNPVPYDNIRGGVDGGHHHSSCMRSYMNSAKKMKFSRMLRDMLAVKTPVQGDGKTPEKKKRNNICLLTRTLSDKDLLETEGGDAFQEVSFSREIAAPDLKKLNLAGLRSATRNFSQDMVLGEGAFGKVFLGWVKQETYDPSRVGVGMAVAVKKLNTDSFQGLQEWQAEVNILGRLRHSNLVKLLGYCFEDKELVLVYEFMAKGSLENYILKNSLEPLSWEIRLKILIGAAQGLAFLHSTENQIIYRDFKSSNILLDQDFNAKLADFGLATSGPINGDAHISTQVMGTQGYASPEYVATGHLNGKNDVYAFGVVLLETLTGLRVIDKTRPKEERNLVEWARPFLPNKKKLKGIIDPSLGHDYPTEGAFQCAALVLKCTHLEPTKRPSIEQVLQSLEKISGIKMKSSKCTS